MDLKSYLLNVNLIKIKPLADLNIQFSYILHWPEFTIVLPQVFY